MTDPTEMYLSDMYTISINIAGNAGMSFPLGLGRDTDLPVGVQLIAPAFKDENMLQAAAALESVYGKAPIAAQFADDGLVASNDAPSNSDRLAGE